MQTAECIALGEILKLDLIVILNKIDLLNEKTKWDKISKTKSALKNMFKKSEFINKNKIQIIEYSGKNSQDNETLFEFSKNEEVNEIIQRNGKNVNILRPKNLKKNLVTKILEESFLIKNQEKINNSSNKDGELVCLADHCFNLKGKGTILTGTVTQGKITIGDKISLPEFGEDRIVKGLQVYRRDQKSVSKGDRVAILVPSLNAKSIERCIITTPNQLKPIDSIFAVIHPVKHFKGEIKSKSKFHLTINHVNVMAELTLFCSPNLAESKLESLHKNLKLMKNQKNENICFDNCKMDWKLPFEYVEGISKDKIEFTKREEKWDVLSNENKVIFVLIRITKPIYISKNAFFIGSRFDFHQESKDCRIAFYGHCLESFNSSVSLQLINDLQVFIYKEREAVVDKFVNDHTIIVKEMFQKETNVSLFFGKYVFVFVDQDCLKGEIFAAFGNSGKVKVRFDDDLSQFKDKLKNCRVTMKIQKQIKLC